MAGMLYGGCRLLPKPLELPAPLAGRDCRFYSYGRHALLEALRLAGVRRGDTVLLPEYICRENLSALHALDARAEYYPVSDALELMASTDSLPQARAIMAVNYFGFPQGLAPFEAYCQRTGAVLIEDNAHGFLSRDEAGAYLGTRGDIGVFSFRKTLPLVNGSGLLVMHPEKTGPLPPQLTFMEYAEPRNFRIKKHLRRLTGWHMTGLLYAISRLDRSIRKWRTGVDYVRSGPEAEQEMPGSAEPDARLLERLKSLDVPYEIERRRSLYAALEKLVVEHGGKPVFPALPQNAVPYGFPFRAPRDAIARIKNALQASHFDCHLWPELPSEIELRAPERYKSVWLVNFIW